MTTVTQILLVPPVSLTTQTSAAYTVPPATTAKIGRAVFTNTSTIADNITAGLSTAGTLNSSNTLISGRPIAPGEAYVSPELAGLVMPQNYNLLVLHSTTTASVGFTVSGLTII